MHKTKIVLSFIEILEKHFFNIRTYNAAEYDIFHYRFRDNIRHFVEFFFIYFLHIDLILSFNQQETDKHNKSSEWQVTARVIVGFENCFLALSEPLRLF